MAQSASFGGDLLVQGTIYAQGISAPPTAIIPVQKLEHQYSKTVSQEGATTAAAERRIAHVVYGATGTILSYRAGLITACIGAAVVSVDLLKNGVSILSAAITLDSSVAPYVEVSGTVVTATVVAGDDLEVKITVVAGGGTLGKGVYASLILREDAI